MQALQQDLSQRQWAREEKTTDDYLDHDLPVLLRMIYLDHDLFALGCFVSLVSPG